jgi:hypothetical protein
MTTSHPLIAALPPLPRVLVCGSRDWTDRELIERVLATVARPAHLIHGDARGADRLAVQVVRQLGWSVTAYPACWSRYGRAAGPRRNREMLDAHPDLVIGFSLSPSGTPGTRDTLREANRRGILVLIVSRDGRIRPFES